MKKAMYLFLTAMMISALFCMPATAAESSPHLISMTVAIASDYMYRGVSETGHDESVQASLDYEHASGFYMGAWWGNIDGDSEYVDDYDAWTYATDGINYELDFYAGYWVELGPIELDLMATYMYFPESADSGLKADPDYDDWIEGEAESDYVEFHIGLAHRFNLPTVPKLSLGYDYTPNYWGEDGTGHHANAILEFGIPFDMALALEAGYQTVEGDKQSGSDSSGYSYGVDEEDGFEYTYYRVGVSWYIADVSCDVSYHFGNSEKDWFEDVYGSQADNTWVVTISYTF